MFTKSEQLRPVNAGCLPRWLPPAARHGRPADMSCHGHAPHPHAGAVVGARLLHRTTRRVTLTHAGRKACAAAMPDAGADGRRAGRNCQAGDGARRTASCG
jgi:hypothetical protein